MKCFSFLSKNTNSDPSSINNIRKQRHPSRIQARFFQWIDKRSPMARSVLLTRKNLYIFPTVTGLSFFAMSFILWLLGTSYQNNLILALSYLLISLIVVAIFHTYANLAGLQIKLIGAKPVFVGENAYFALQVQGPRNKGYDNLTMRWWQGEDACFDFECDDNGKVNAQIKVAVYAAKRGILLPSKLLIESAFPLGIIRCWTWLNLEGHAIIFPKPLKTAFPNHSCNETTAEHGDLFAGGDEFVGLKVYRPGDPIKHIAWKHYAREQGLYSKEYGSERSNSHWLAWDDFLHLAPEDRLRALCYWVLEFHRLGIAYGLRLPGNEFTPALDDSHRLNVLCALARCNINQGGY